MSDGIILVWLINIYFSVVSLKLEYLELKIFENILSYLSHSILFYCFDSIISLILISITTIEIHILVIKKGNGTGNPFSGIHIYV